MSTQTDRAAGVDFFAALKAPVQAATTANITLSGTQTIDGTAVVADDRVLVKDQTDATENGIYVVSATAWSRAADSDATGDLISGTLVAIVDGSANGEEIWMITTTGTITIDSTSITWVQIV